MQGLWLEDGKLRFRDDLPAPEPGPGEVRVRVLQAGICGTDLGLVRGLYPYTGIPGHEFAGIAETGSSSLRGQRVVGEINAVCGTCRLCRRGLSNHCSERTVLGIVNRPGAFAEYLLLPEANLHPVPDSVSTAAAALSEPLAAAFEILEQVPIGSADRVVVVGDGRLGQMIARVLATTDCELTVVGRHASKLERLGDIRAQRVLGDAFEDREFDVAVECTGNASGFAVARAALRPQGTLVMKSTIPESLHVDVTSLVVDEITLIGSRCGPFAPALRWLEADATNGSPDRTQPGVASLIDATYSLAEGVQAFEHSRRSDALKVMLRIGAEH